ncbi:hypothetical protein QTL95_12915 [Rhizobium sp. S152]|uniref:hypothetical protein n=1 Tax=Rhizobium sp. S152 TaxID=3055038 RepID=UPI0025A9E036|nr:hypothetical protein [Rhizobium sp. S152]MDM9626803.1 hypothetical protein [Rhizobium sp. S152]
MDDRLAAAQQADIQTIAFHIFDGHTALSWTAWIPLTILQMAFHSPTLDREPVRTMI